MVLAHGSGDMVLSQPRDLGCYGETFPIQEVSLLDVIRHQLKGLVDSDSLDQHQKLIQERMVHRIQHPSSVEGLKPTTHPRAFTLDPTFVLDQDIKDAQGRILYPQGTKINPLHYVSLSKPLLFVDGDVHQDWVKEQSKQSPHAKVILVKGSPLALEKDLNHPVYFDQGGFLSKRLGLSQIPARVTQQGDHLLIEEVLLTEILPAEIISEKSSLTEETS